MSSPLLAVADLPTCTIKHATSQERRNCPTHHQRELAVERQRRADIRAGIRPARMPNAADQPVPRCPVHTIHHAGCPDCQAYSRYDSAVRRRMRREGKLHLDVDIDIVRQHLAALTDKKTGGWTYLAIANRTGIGRNELYGFMRVRSRRVRGATWLALRDLKPMGVPTPVRKGSVPALESQRIVQGLVAQGWPVRYLAELKGLRSHDNTLTKLAAGMRRNGVPLKWVHHTTRDLVRTLRDKLGEFDIAQLPRPLPDMSEQAAASAHARGWVPLSAWGEQDLADPNAVPFTGLRIVLADDDDDEPAPAALPMVDWALTSKIRRTADKLNQHRLSSKGRQRGRWHTAHIDQITNLTRLEVHAVAKLATDLGMSEAEIGIMIGYGHTNDRELEAAQRQACRLTSAVKRATAWIDNHPTGWVPWWFTFIPRGNKRDLDTVLPAFLALQPAPYGPGWTIQELALRCGVTVDEMDRFLQRMASTAGALWLRPARRTSDSRAASDAA